MYKIKNSLSVANHEFLLKQKSRKMSKMCLSSVYN